MVQIAETLRCRAEVAEQHTEYAEHTQLQGKRSNEMRKIVMSGQFLHHGPTGFDLEIQLNQLIRRLKPGPE